jgi:hypothetical protein
MNEISELDRLRKESGKPTVHDLWKAGFSEGLDPDAEIDFELYQDDPIGFVEDVLGAELWDKQRELLEAIRDIEIVQVRSATGVGKTFALGHAAVWIYKSFPKAQVYTTSAPPEGNLRRLLWGEIYALAKDHAELFLTDDVRASLLIQRHPKQFIVGVTIPSSSSDEEIETKWSGKHSPELVFIMDEGDGVPDPVYKGADGCMSGGVFVRQVVCFNPKKKSGEAYRREMEGRAHVIVMSALEHPNVITGKNIIPGAVTQEVTIRRIYQWTDPKPIKMEVDSTCWEVPEFLIGKTAKLPSGKLTPPLRPGWRVIIDDQFYYKVLAEYPQGGQNQLIWDSWIDDAVSRWEMMRTMNGGQVIPPQGIKPTMGLDVADLGPDKDCAAFRYGTWWDIPETWKSIDPHNTAERAAREYKERNAAMCKVDATGVGAGVPGAMMAQADKLNFYITAYRVMVAESASGFLMEEDEDGEASLSGEFVYIRDEAYWAVRTAFRKGNVALPPETYNEDCRRLHESLKSMTYEITAKNKIAVVSKKILRKVLGYSPDEMEAFMLTYAQQNTWMGGI